MREMRRAWSALLIALFLFLPCARAEYARYPEAGEAVPQLHALIVNGASQIQRIYAPVSGCEEIYEALGRDRIFPEVQAQNLSFHKYDAEESIAGPSAVTRAQFDAWLDDAFGGSADGDLNLFYYCGHTMGDAGDLSSYGAMLSGDACYRYGDLAQALAGYRGDFLVFIDACFSETFQTEGIDRLPAQERGRFTLVYAAAEDAEAWMGAMTNAVAKGIGRGADGRMRADGNGDGVVALMELFSFMQADADGDGDLSAGELFGKVLTTGAASMSVSQGKDYCLFQFASAQIQEERAAIGLRADPAGEAVQLHAALEGAEDGAGQAICWQSSDEGVVSVDGDGRLTPHAEGEATITAFLRDAYGNPCIGSADTCLVAVREAEVQFYGQPSVDEWGNRYTAVRMRTVDASGGVLDDVLVGAMRPMVGERFAAYRTPDGLIYCELATMLDGVAVRYYVYRLTDGIPALLCSVRDPGYTSGVGLYDGQTEAQLLSIDQVSSWRDAEAEYRAALNAAFAASGLRFDGVATVESHDGRQFREFASAALPDWEPLCLAGSCDALPGLLELSGMGAGGSAELESIAPVAGVDAGDGSVVTTGNVNIRSTPGLDGDAQGTARAGATLDYLGETSVDERGVAWYKIRFNGIEGWISSKYAELKS